jgi:hypothetical protein
MGEIYDVPMSVSLGAPNEDPIVVTPAMIEAGVVELASWEDGVDSGDAIVAAVYRAMVRASSHGRSK